MSISLYGRLFKYRPSEGRLTREDFLTEALCDLLNRLDKDQLLFFLEVLIGKRAPAVWEKCIRDDSSCTWQTQRTISGTGRLDLVLEIDEFVLIGVEVKRDAHFQKNNEREQLESYGDWLRSQYEDSGLAVLTHSTPPPSDFDTTDSHSEKYKVKFRSVCRWSDVWRWLTNSEQVGSHGGQKSWPVLSGELAKFLQENEMDNETINFRDLAASEIFLNSQLKFAKTFSVIGSKLKALVPIAAKTKPNFENCTYDGAGGVVRSDGIRLGGQSKVLEATYLQWGIFFPVRERHMVHGDGASTSKFSIRIHIYRGG